MKNKRNIHNPSAENMHRSFDVAFKKWLDRRGLPDMDWQKETLDFKSINNHNRLDIEDAPLSEREIKNIYWQDNIHTMR